MNYTETLAVEIADHKNLAQQISANLGLKIIQGEVSPGELLPTENELSESLGVSRSVVREAFKLLTAKGIIVSKRRMGTVVSPVSEWILLDPEILFWMESTGYSYQILHELIQIRLAIEPEACAIVAKQRELTDFSTMAKSLKILECDIASPEEYRKADIDFHLSILEATQNRYFKQMKPLLKTSLVFCDTFAETSQMIDGKLMVDTEQHRKVLTAMLDGRVDDARSLSYALISRIGDFVETLV